MDLDILLRRAETALSSSGRPKVWLARLARGTADVILGYSNTAAS